eukprot:5077731-Pyramimonas_sp.AAC.1
MPPGANNKAERFHSARITRICLFDAPQKLFSNVVIVHMINHKPSPLGSSDGTQRAVPCVISPGCGGALCVAED